MKVYIPSHNGRTKCIMILDSEELEPVEGAKNKYVLHSEHYDYIYDSKTIFTDMRAVKKLWDGEKIPKEWRFKK